MIDWNARSLSKGQTPKARRLSSDSPVSDYEGVDTIRDNNVGTIDGIQNLRVRRRRGCRRKLNTDISAHQREEVREQHLDLIRASCHLTRQDDYCLLGVVARHECGVRGKNR